MQEREAEMTEEMLRPGRTFKVPSWSTTESSRALSYPTKIFSPDVVYESDENAATSTNDHRASEERWEYGDPSRLDEEIEDNNPLIFSASVLDEAEKKMKMRDRDRESIRRGKRPWTESIDARYANKRMRRRGRNEPTSAEIRFFEGKPYIPLEEQEHGEDGNSDGIEDDEEEEGEEEIGEPRPPSSRGKPNDLIGHRRRLAAEGSPTPPGIADLDGGPPQTRTSDPDTEFWPGDPVFMFGETKYLQALKSRQIEKDLASSACSFFLLFFYFFLVAIPCFCELFKFSRL